MAGEGFTIGGQIDSDTVKRMLSRRTGEDVQTDSLYGEDDIRNDPGYWASE